MNTAAILLLSLTASSAWVVPQATTLTSLRLFGSVAEEYADHDVYQRVFYRFSPGSDCDNAIMMEERCKFVLDPDNPEYLKPAGERNIILRDGRVEDGEIGDDLFQLSSLGPHTGAGTNADLQVDLVAAMYLAANPSFCQGKVLEIDAGVAGALGCLGAGCIERRDAGSSDNPIEEDVLTISDEDNLFSKDLELLALAGDSEKRLRSLHDLLKANGAVNSKVTTGVVDWRIRNARQVGKTQRYREYKNIVASNMDLTYPEAKELARNVANRLEANTLYDVGRLPLPRFVFICRSDRDESPTLRNFLEKGFKMTTSTNFLKLEKLIFKFQKLPTGSPENELDDLELELSDFKEVKYQCLLAQHHPEYAGEGSGELFFPMETGEYDATGGSTYLEKETGMNPF